MKVLSPWIVQWRAWHKLMVFLVISGCTVLDSPSARVHAGAPQGTPHPTDNTASAAGKSTAVGSWLGGLFQRKPKDDKNAEGPKGAKGAKSESPEPDATAGLSGQPYFLPRGLIHLVVKPTSTGGGGAAAPAGGTTTNTPANTNTTFTINGTVTQSTGTGGTDNSNTTKTPSATTDTGTTALTYQITADVVYVPDMTCGPFLAHYKENPLFSENITVGVTADGLLTTATSTSTDQTPQIITNLVQTGLDVLSFGAQLPLGVGAVPPSPKVAGASKSTTTGLPKSIKYVKYKRLDIDVTFDPFDKEQVENVRGLFRPIVQIDPGFQTKKDGSYDPTDSCTPFPLAENGSSPTADEQRSIDDKLKSDAGGQIYYISPFTLDIVTRIGPDLQIGNAPQDPNYSAQNGKTVTPPSGTLSHLRSKFPNNFPKNNLGLLFREPTPVQITLTQNSPQFRQVAANVCAFNFYRLKDLHNYENYPDAKLADEVAAVDSFANLVKTDAPDPNNTTILQNDLPAFKKILTDLKDTVDKFSTDFESAKQFLAALGRNYEPPDAAARAAAVEKAKADAKAAGKTEAEQAAAGIAAANKVDPDAKVAQAKALAGDVKVLQTFLGTLSKDPRIFPNTDTLTNYQNEVTYERNALFTAVPMPSRTARLIKSVPNPYRVVAIEIKRRPFVANSGLNLTISNGMLTQLNINKQSEILGFTQIPLNIAQALVTVPNNLLTLRTQNLTDKSALVNAQNSLVNAQDASQLQQNTALLNAQAAQLNAQAAKLKAEAALNSARAGK